MPHRIPKQAKPRPELQTAVLDEARERARQLHQPDTASKTDQSVTPQIADIEEEGPGPAEGHTDNRAGG